MASVLCTVPYNAVRWAWNTLLDTVMGVTNAGRAASDGAKEGVQRLQDVVDTTKDAFDGLHPWVVVPLRIVARLCFWVIKFFQAFVFLPVTCCCRSVFQSYGASFSFLCIFS